MREEWLKQRSKGIGGSDAAVVCGLSPWKSPYRLYLEKRGEIEGFGQEESEAMTWGTLLEPVIRQRYADVTGRLVTVPNSILVNPDHDFMIANVDGITSDRRVLEVKTARSATGWGDQGTDQIPEMYLLQVQHYLTVTKLEVADVAALIGGSDFRIYEIVTDKELEEMLIEREAAFWERVVKGIPPEPTTFDDIKKKYGSKSNAVMVQASEPILSALERLKDLKRLSEEEEGLKALIMGYMKEADTLVRGDDVLVTWKSGKPAKRFDLKTFQLEQPKLYQEYLKEGESSRKFLIK